MRRLAPAVTLAAGLGGCAGVQSALDPAGPGAARIGELAAFFTVVTLAASAVVIALVLYAVARARRRAHPGTLPLRDDAFILLGGFAGPAVILISFQVLSALTSAEVSRPPAEPALTVEVTGHQFWWEVRYPAFGITTANEIHIPAGVPVEVRVTASDVIHSFWVPRLHGKIDMTPGKTAVWWVQADAPGRFRGQCAEFCGLQHSLMAFWVFAEPPDAFEAWVAARRRGRPAGDDPRVERGRTVFFEAGCAHCHAVRGVNEPRFTGAVGPDLTHLASRRTLAAATVDNNRATLTAFILEPHAVKPGVRMPPTRLDSARLDALVAFLESLR
jgi:cytochrome c oxidase subunit II